GRPGSRVSCQICGYQYGGASLERWSAETSSGLLGMLLFGAGMASVPGCPSTLPLYCWLTPIVLVTAGRYAEEAGPPSGPHRHTVIAVPLLGFAGADRLGEPVRLVQVPDQVPGVQERSPASRASPPLEQRHVSRETV